MEIVDEFAPNGNDTGADTLEIFREWNEKNKSKSAIEFLFNLLNDWGIDIDNPYADDYSSHTYFQTVVGLAFASAKIRGECENMLKELAILAIDLRLETLPDENKWEFRKECESKLSRCKMILEKMP